MNKRGTSAFDQETVDFHAEGTISITTGGQFGRRRTSVDRTRFGPW